MEQINDDFRSMVTEVRKEADNPFKGADAAELAKRQVEYEKLRKQEEKLRKQEEEQAKKEREARWKALGPRAERVQRLVPVVRELWKEYTDDQADWVGNYNEHDNWDQPTSISFNIKMYGSKTPDWAREKLDKFDLEETFYEAYSQYLQDQLEGFAEGLTEDYDFIEKWGVDGRSGGWLVLQVSPITPDDMFTVLDVFSGEAESQEEEWMDPRSLQQAYVILRDAKKAISDRIDAYQEIADKVEKGKKDAGKYAESDEYLNDFFENHADEMEEPEEPEAK